MAKKFKLILAAFLAALTIGALPTAATFADDTYEKAPIHLQVTPAKQKISLAPGSSYVGSFTVMNVGSEPFHYSVYATPYNVINDNYDPDYVSVKTYSHMADWITFDKKTEKGLLQPGAKAEVAYTVNVPKDVAGGTQYAALMAETQDGNDESANIQVVHRVGTILSAAVPGETREEVEVVSNNINSFYFAPPISVSSLVKNTGNVEAVAKYTVKIYPLFSKESVFNNEENPTELDIMPDTSRFNSISWEEAPRLGIFSVEQIIEAGGKISTNQKLVLICPLWLLFIIFALLFAIIFWLVSRSRNRKQSKSSKSKKEEE